MKGILLLLGLGAILIGATASALTQNRQCVADAQRQRQSCKTACDDTFKAAKDDCWNVNHDCADACRADRDVCFAPIYAALQSCLDGCNATLDASKAYCRGLYGEGTPERDQCIDAAQVTAFMCRDSCRESVDKSALKQCRTAFHKCMVACPPQATPTPAN